MRNLLKMRRLTEFIILSFIVLVFISCNNEDLFIEDDVEVIDEDTVSSEDTDKETVNEEIDFGLPCDFTLDNVESNSTIIINCVLDLQGETINLPENVTIVYEGGEIINGILNFSNGSTIDGELLNSTITLSGSSPQLKDPSFIFNPSRWGIVEGKVSDEVALENKNILQNCIDITKKMGVSTFELSKMDAYFHVALGWGSADGYSENGISLPSDFHLKMSDDTYLRTQPNKYPFNFLLAVYIKENVKISGGNLIGDRYTHDYSPINDTDGIARNDHGWGTLLWIGGSKFVTATNINIKDATGDGVWLGAVGHRYNGVAFNKNIIIENCVVDNCRRNNFSITDGEDLYIENCKIINAGGGDNVRDSDGKVVYSSAGVAPKFGLDVEPYMATFENGESRFNEKVENCYIRGCTFENNEAGSIIDYSGINVVIENNISDGGFYADNSTGTQFLNNTLQADEIKFSAAITTGSWLKKVYGVETEFSKNNIVRGNKISGFNVGIDLRGEDITVSGNIIDNFGDGIRVLDVNNCNIFNNELKSSLYTNSVGLKCRNGIVNNLVFSNNYVEVPRVPFALSDVNQLNPEYTLKFSESTFKATTKGYSISIKNTDNVEITNNILTNTTINTEGSNNIVTSGNIYN